MRTDGYYCKNCNQHVPSARVVLDTATKRSAGSGQIAGPSYRHQLMREMLKHE